MAGGPICLTAASRFVDVPEEEINLIKENAIPRNTKHATKLGMALLKFPVKILLGIMKVHALHYANELLVRVRLPFQKLLQTRSTGRNNEKKCLGKE